MKRCPECRRNYYDETLLYCLDDGNALLDGPGSGNEPATAVLADSAAHVSTQPQIHATDQAELRPTGETDVTRATQMLAAPRLASPRRPAALGLVILLLLAAAGGIAWYLWSKKAPAKVTGPMKVTRLTSHGQVGLPAISPDGKYVIYTLWEAGKGTLWLRQVSTNSAVPLVQPGSEEVNYGGRTFSRNGEMIYYVYYDKDNVRGALMELPTLGGVPRKILTDLSSGISFSPDGKRFAFRREIPSDGSSALLIADADGGGIRTIATRSGSDWIIGDPAWSPDGASIACGIGTDVGGISLSVAAFSVNDGNGKLLTEHKWRGGLTQIAWTGDGSGLVVAAAEETSSASQIWELSIPSGSVRQVTNDVNGYNYVSVTADSSALVTRQEDPTQRIWTYTVGDDPTRGKLVTNGKSDGYFGLSWTPDGKIIYSSRVGDNFDLSIMKEDGTGNRQLTADPSWEFHPCTTADGRYIFFASDREGGPQIFRMAADGSGLKQLTFGVSKGDPECSPDSNWIVFNGYDTGPRTIWKVPTEGGEPTQITPKPVENCYFQPGNDLFCVYADDGFSPPRRRAARVSLDGTQFVPLFDVPPLARAYSFTPDGKSFIYTLPTGGIENLWTQPSGGGAAKQLTNFKSDGKMDAIYRMAWSQDSKRVALVRGNTATDVVLIKDFHQP